VADSTFKRDDPKPGIEGHRTHNSQIYAKAGIDEYSIINIKKCQVVVLQEPQDGFYQYGQTFTKNDQIAPLLLPDLVGNLRT
jgi:Uma2 family endonuclease